MKNKVGMKTKHEVIMAADSVSGKEFRYEVKFMLIKRVLATVVMITKTAEGVCFWMLSSLFWLLKTLPSLKVTLLKRFKTNSIIMKEKTKPIVKDPRTTPKANSKFQKLSLFANESNRVPRKSLSATLLARSNCTSCVVCLSSFVKSSMANTYNLWFQIYRIIISNLYKFFKQILSLMLVVSLALCSNSAVALVDDKANQQYNEQDLSSLIASAEIEHNIPSGLLFAIAKTESGMKAYALNIGGRAVFLPSISKAQEVLEDKLSSGLTNIDVGVMQVNYRWHSHEFDSLEEMLTPASNISYAAKLLKSLYVQHGTWHKAVRYYHSANSEHHKKYSRKVVMCWLNE